MLKANQLLALKFGIAADQVLAAKSASLESDHEIMLALNAEASPTQMGWRTDTPAKDIIDAIAWDKYTPNTPVNGTALQSNQFSMISIKLQILANLLRGETVDMSRAKTRASLRDAVINIPAGAVDEAGVVGLVNAAGTGGAGVLTAGTRKLTRVEVILASGPEVTGPTTALVTTFQGELNVKDIKRARAA